MIRYRCGSAVGGFLLRSRCWTLLKPHVSHHLLQLGSVLVDTIDELVAGLRIVPLTSPKTRTPLKLGKPVLVEQSSYCP